MYHRGGRLSQDKNIGYGTEAYTRAHGSLGTLAVGYDDDSQRDPAEAETLEEGMTQPKVFGHGNVLA